MNSQDPFGELTPGRGLPAGLRQRFPDRVLVMTTNRCFAPCAHCTRKFILGRTDLADTPARIAACADWVKRHAKVRDVLLSGGDVLTLDDAQVVRLVEAFASLRQVEVVRICTRAPVSRPARVTVRLARLLARAGRGKV
ncbi:MAG: lysine 2,3-aminomutase, partial [Kiritimatiellae bacterium]|nr:lysine 2,3-aminomutase [Kiritimatiellia bacterium]